MSPTLNISVSIPFETDVSFLWVFFFCVCFQQIRKPKSPKGNFWFKYHIYEKYVYFKFEQILANYFPKAL